MGRHRTEQGKGFIRFHGGSTDWCPLFDGEESWVGVGLGVDAAHPSGERSFRVAVAPSYAEADSSVVSSSDKQLPATNGILGQRADFSLPMRGPYFIPDGGAINGEML